MGELASELAVSKERFRQQKDMIDEKFRSQEEILAQNQLKSIELQNKVETLN